MEGIPFQQGRLTAEEVAERSAAATKLGLLSIEQARSARSLHVRPGPCCVDALLSPPLQTPSSLPPLLIAPIQERAARKMGVTEKLVYTLLTAALTVGMLNGFWPRMHGAPTCGADDMYAGLPADLVANCTGGAAVGLWLSSVRSAPCWPRASLADTGPPL